MHVRSVGREDPLEKEMATHSSTPAWRIPWTEEPGRLQSMGSQTVGDDWATSLSLKTCSQYAWTTNEWVESTKLRIPDLLLTKNMPEVLHNHRLRNKWVKIKTVTFNSVEAEGVYLQIQEAMHSSTIRPQTRHKHSKRLCFSHSRNSESA